MTAELGGNTKLPVSDGIELLEERPLETAICDTVSPMPNRSRWSGCLTRREWLAAQCGVALCVFTPVVVIGQDETLHEGTPVRMRLSRTISSATAKLGENVDFETLDDIKVGDLVVIPKSSVAMATVTEAQPKKSMGRAGKLNVTIDYVRLPSGEKLPLRGVQDVKGGGHVGAMTGAMVATSIVFFPAAPLFLFMKGKDITIPKGHEITVYTNTDLRFSKRSDSSPITPTTKTAAAVPTGPSMTNADVLALKEAGISEAVIVGKIKSSPTKFAIETADLISLKKAGVSDAIIAAMLEASKP
jgi:hypothetical protein